MDKEFCNELNELLVTTYKSIQSIETMLTDDLSEGRLSIGELHILETIGEGMRREGGAAGVTITEIAECMSITLPSATVAVKKLEKKGFVTKERSQEDRRAVLVRLTREGQRADTAHRYFHRLMVREVASSMPQADRRALIDGLVVLNSFFQQRAARMRQTHAESGLTADDVQD